MVNLKLISSISILTLVGAFILFLFLPINEPPNTFVENRTVSHKDSIFFKQDTVRYPAKAIVKNLTFVDNKVKIGIASQTYELNFGEIPIEVVVRKTILLKNNEMRPVKVKFAIFGNITPYIELDENYIILEPLESREIEVKLNATTIGEFNGELDVIVKSPKYDFLVPFIEWV